MTNIAASSGSLPNILQTVSTETKVIADNQFSNQQQQITPAHPFTALASQPGVMDAILNGQSLMAAPQNQPSLATPQAGAEKLNAEQVSHLLKLATATSGNDISKLEQTAASAAVLLGGQTSAASITSRTNDVAKTSLRDIQPAATGSSSVAHSHKTVEGGTDITAPEGTSRQFINVMGDMKMLNVNSMLTIALTKAEADSAISSARSTVRMVESADRMGTKLIDAARTQMNGSITSGTIGVVGQGASSGMSLKALHSESNSLKTNCTLSNEAKNISINQHNQVAASMSTPEHKSKYEDTLTGSNNRHVASAGQETVKRDIDHKVVENNSHRTRTISDFSSQATQSTQGIITGAYNLDASQDSKESQLAHADQNVQSEVANSHQQTAKKAAEARAALQQLFESTQNSNNSAASAIADRMR